MIFDSPKKKHQRPEVKQIWKKLCHRETQSIFQTKKSPFFLQEKFHQWHPMPFGKVAVLWLHLDQSRLSCLSRSKNLWTKIDSNLCPPMYTYGTDYTYIYKKMCFHSIHIIFYLPISIDPFFCFQMPLGKAMMHWSSMAVAEEAAVVTPVLRTFGKGKDVDKASQRK